MGNTMKAFLLLLGLSGVFSSPSKTDRTTRQYQNCHAVAEDKINIHLIPHSHDDAGWLQTVDRYYFGNEGTRNYENAGVQYIITSTVEALKKDPERRYIQVETAFLWKWWQHQDDAIKKDFTDLVRSGQLEIINAGWTMNDEAAVHYQSTIDQFTWGFRKVEEMTKTSSAVKIGWQIDPFGHSREHASIVKQLGFDGLIIGRLDYRDKDNRKENKALDFIWQGSANLDDSEIFTSMFPDFYISVIGYCWDVTCADSPLVEDEDSPEYNLKAKVDGFARVMDEYSSYYQTRNVLLPMGGDFQYQAAELNFLNIDKLIKGFEGHDKYNVIYSTPSCYIEAVNDQVRKDGIELAKKTDDFFPYASNSHDFWTGYFTSRPASKRFERLSNNILQGARQLAAFSKVKGNDVEDSIVNLYDAVGILQHHDAITGTAKQKVAEDYSRLLTSAIKEAEQPIGGVIGDLLKKDPESVVELKLSTCLLANVSICETTNADRFVAVVYNPLGRVVSHYVRLPVEDGTYKVTGPDGEETNDVLDTLSTFDYIPDAKPSPKELVFKAKDLPPLGIKLYYVEKSAPASKDDSDSSADDEDLDFGTEINGFSIDKTSKLLNSVTIQGQKLEITQEFLYYSASVGDNGDTSKRSSGAYIFRPDGADPKPIAKGPIVIQPQKGNLVDEVRQVIDNQVTQIIRVYKSDDDSYIEFDWLVGDLEVNEETQVGREVITRFTVKDFANKGVFYTDSNGREQIKRELNKRSDYEYDPSEEPVSSNYYPITARIVIKDEDKGLEVAVLNDRAQGGTSLSDGVIELMVHRRLLHDDAFGVNEALNEVEFDKGLYVRGQHYLTFGPTASKVDDGKSTAAYERDLAQRILLAPWVLVGDASSEDATLENIQDLLNFEFSGLKSELPENVHLLTFGPWNGIEYILRLEHFLEKGEDDTLSAPVTINLGDLFNGFTIDEYDETLLGANSLVEDYEKEYKFVWNKDVVEKTVASSVAAADPLEVELKPMQIRTFVFTVTDETKKSNRENETNIRSIVNRISSYFY